MNKEPENKDKRIINPDDAAKKLQGMVTLGIPDTRLSGQISVQQPLQDTLSEEETKREEPSVPSVRTRKRKDQVGDYKETYFKRIDFSDRQPLYITRITHEKLMLIVNIVGGRKAAISSYVENILLQHLESNKEEINRLYDDNYTRPLTDK
jgi:hypothetical protein